MRPVSARRNAREVFKNAVAFFVMVLAGMALGACLAAADFMKGKLATKKRVR